MRKENTFFAASSACLIILVAAALAMPLKSTNAYASTYVPADIGNVTLDDISSSYQQDIDCQDDYEDWYDDGSCEEYIEDIHGEGVGVDADGIPDCCQCRVAFYGDGILYDFTLAYVTLKDEDGNPSPDGIAYLPASLVPKVEIMEGYDESTLTWDDEEGEPYPGHVLKGDCVVFYGECEPEDDTSLEDIYEPRAWDGSGNIIGMSEWLRNNRTISDDLGYAESAPTGSPILEEHFISEDEIEDSSVIARVFDDSEESRALAPSMGMADIWFLANAIGAICAGVAIAVISRAKRNSNRCE